MYPCLSPPREKDRERERGREREREGKRERGREREKERERERGKEREGEREMTCYHIFINIRDSQGKCADHADFIKQLQYKHC